MERAERMILLAIGLLSASFLVPVLWVMLALTMVTAIGRFARVWRLAEAPVSVSAVRRPRRTRTAMRGERRRNSGCLLYTSDAADDLLCVDLGGRRIIK